MTHVSIDTQVEQMLARGRSLDYILARLPVTERDVDRAIARMDAACGDDAAWENARRATRTRCHPKRAGRRPDTKGVGSGQRSAVGT